MTISLDLIAKTMSAFGGRRFLLTVGCGLVTTVVLAFKLIGEATYATIILGTVGSFITGNTYESVKNNPKP